MTSIWIPDHAGQAVIVVTSWMTGGWGLEGVCVSEVSLLITSVVWGIVLKSHAVIALVMERVVASCWSLVCGRGMLCPD